MPRTTTRIRQSDITFKDTVVAATQSDIADLASGAPDTVDGVGLALNDRVLVKAQSAGAENGIYRVTVVGTGADGTWVRVDDMQVGTDNQGGIVVPVEGTGATTDTLTMYHLTTPGANVNLDVGADSQTWAKMTDVGVTAADHVIREVPSGAIDNSNVTFTLAFTPILGKEEVYLNGILQNEGASNDYTISAAVITMNDAPKGAAGNPDLILVSYLK